MSKQNELVKLARTGASGGGGKNVVINGAMQVSQRTASVTNVGNQYVLDRFFVYKQNTSTTFNCSQASVTDLAGFASSLKMECTGVNVTNVNYTVTVGSISDGYGGTINIFKLNGVNYPSITLARGATVVFDVSDSTNSGHPLRFKDASGNTFPATVSGTEGTSGATVTLNVPTTGTMPASYYCTVHGAGMGNSITVSASNALTANEEGYIQHKIEGLNLNRFGKGLPTASGFALSFYVKTNKLGFYTVRLLDVDNTRAVSGSYTVTNTNWNRYTISFPADTTGAFDNDNNSSLEIFFKLFAGSDTDNGTLQTTWGASADANSATGQVNLADSASNVWEITGIQLEVGDRATDFEHMSFGNDLARCQRYYHQETVNWALGVEGTRNTRLPFNHKVSMRATPTAALSGGTISGSGALMGTSSNTTETTNFEFWRGASGGLVNATFIDYSLTLNSEL
tara:strand:+ start:2480 stop:3844 length:1365 start_codon:yes stop_codon:yes gene_type:complete